MLSSDWIKREREEHIERGDKKINEKFDNDEVKLECLKTEI